MRTWLHDVFDGVREPESQKFRLIHDHESISAACSDVTGPLTTFRYLPETLIDLARLRVPDDLFVPDDPCWSLMQIQKPETGFGGYCGDPSALSRILDVEFV